MKQETEAAINLCIEALNGPTEGNDKKVLERILQIAELPYHGRNLGLGTGGYRGYRSTVEGFYKRFEGRKQITDSLSWLDAILFLYDAVNYDEGAILASAQNIQNDIIFNHILKHIVANLTIKNDIDGAVQFTQHFRATKIFKEEDNLDKGYLIILEHFAALGDVENFFKYFKLSQPAKNKFEAKAAKEWLVENFASRNGIEASIDLCNHKNLGDKFYFSALFSFAQQGKYQDVKSFFAKHPELKQPEEETELHILSVAYLAARKNKFVIDDDFEVLFERALGVNRKLKFGDTKLQDSILLDLGLAELDNAERVKKCRKAIKDNRMKRELDGMPGA